MQPQAHLRHQRRPHALGTPLAASDVWDLLRQVKRDQPGAIGHNQLVAVGAACASAVHEPRPDIVAYEHAKPGPCAFGIG